MAVTVRELTFSTKTKYHLELVAGEAGLSRILNWVYISEDLNTADFLRGGELVITTGVSSRGDEDWLYQFICNMIAHDTCGLIINEGKYIRREDITDRIRNLCNKEQYPLFLMPWEVHIYDITREYYDRLFQETTEKNEISSAFFSVLYGDSEYSRSVHVLENNGFPVSGTYQVAVMEFLGSEEAKMRFSEVLPRLHYKINCYKNEKSLPFTMLESRRNFIVIWKECPEETVREAMKDLTEEVNRAGKRAAEEQKEMASGEAAFCCRTGMGGKEVSLSRLKNSYRQAKAALAMAKCGKADVYCYEDMGFFRLLLAVEDKKILRAYVDAQLGKLISYDKEHGSEYVETLHQYLMQDGSIQKMASRMFCHRNTVNYRVRLLREQFGMDLQSGKVRFDLMTAFQILEYLKIMEASE